MRRHGGPVQSIIGLKHGDECTDDEPTMPTHASAISCSDRSTHVLFNADDHTYLLKKDDIYRMPILSATGACAAAEPAFNMERALACVMRNPRKPKYENMTREQIIQSWEDNKNTAATLGTYAHFQIESMLLGHPYKDIPEVDNALYCLEVVTAVVHTEFAPQDIRVFEVEGLLTGLNNELAGSPDLILQLKPSNDLIIVDWKRSTTNIHNTAKEFMQAPLQDSYYSKYHAQVNLYSHFLEQGGNNVIACFLCNVHPDPNDERVVRVPKRPVLAQRLVCALSRKLNMLMKHPDVPKCELSGRPVRQVSNTNLGSIDTRIARALNLDHTEENTCILWNELMKQPFTRCTDECCEIVETTYICDMCDCNASVQNICVEIE